jgi:hypothetical protein
MPDATVTALKKATRDLLYPSESDEPFRVFHWKGRHDPLTSEELLKITKQDPDTPVEEISLDDFFSELTEEQGLDEEDARKFQNLRKVIEEQLTDVRVFRVGEVKIDVSIVGKTKDGDWAGVKTSSVET